MNEGHWARHDAKSGFKISVVVQPAQFSELDVNDLAFFSNLQKDVPRVTKKKVFDLLEVVKMAWDAYHGIPHGCSVAYAICFRRVLSGLSFINISYMPVIYYSVASGSFGIACLWTRFETKSQHFS